MERYENLEKALCKELEKLDKKYGNDIGEMNPTDLEHADKIYHALKSAETYYAMKEAEGEMDGEYSGEGNSMRRGGRSYRRSYEGSYNDGMSGARYRSPRTGQFVSRDGGYSWHMPMEYIDPYWDRRY